MKLISIVFASLVAVNSFGSEITRTHKFGSAIADRSLAISGRIDHASWIDESRIVYWSINGELVCRDISKNEKPWSINNISGVKSWSMCRKKSLLALVYSEDDEMLIGTTKVRIIDCENGKTVFSADSGQLAKLLSSKYSLPTHVALTPSGAKLVVCCFRDGGYVLDPSFSKIESRFETSERVTSIHVSPDGSRVSLIGDELCIRDLKLNKDILGGTRLKKITVRSGIDAPFVSHTRYDGKETFVYTIDNSWSTGKVFVHNIKTDKSQSFDALNGHIEMDVDFPRKRLVLTGTSKHLTVFNFDGKTLGHFPNSSSQRNMCVEFSPSGDQILVGSWDNTVSVFKIKE